MTTEVNKLPLPVVCECGFSTMDAKRAVDHAIKHEVKATLETYRKLLVLPGKDGPEGSAQAPYLYQVPPDDREAGPILLRIPGEGAGGFKVPGEIPRKLLGRRLTMGSAICDLLEHEPVNKEWADSISNGLCPDCKSMRLLRWCPGSGFHDLCTHIHCLDCDADYCWPIAWDPPMPITKMKGEPTPLQRRQMAEIAKAKNLEIPKFWRTIMESDLQPRVSKAVLRCYECHLEKTVEVIEQAGYWRWRRGKWPRGWVCIEEMSYSEKDKANILYGRCLKC